MNSLVSHIIDTILSDEYIEQKKEKEEYVVVKETVGIGNIVNAFSCVHY